MFIHTLWNLAKLALNLHPAYIIGMLLVTCIFHVSNSGPWKNVSSNTPVFFSMKILVARYSFKSAPVIKHFNFDK